MGTTEASASVERTTEASAEGFTEGTFGRSHLDRANSLLPAAQVVHSPSKQKIWKYSIEYVVMLKNDLLA